MTIEQTKPVMATPDTPKPATGDPAPQSPAGDPKPGPDVNPSKPEQK